MISYAAPQGSVGKHFDQYDVFLVQGSGQRRWQLGEFCGKDVHL
jgi:50S ribosomal protein L16 3-hydroxylase